MNLVYLFVVGKIDSFILYSGRRTKYLNMTWVSGNIDQSARGHGIQDTQVHEVNRGYRILKYTR